VTLEAAGFEVQAVHTSSLRRRRSTQTGTGFGLLHTPRRLMIVETPERFPNRMGDRNSTTYPNLAVQVLYMDFLPTPTRRDYRSGFQQDSEAFNKRLNHPRGVNLHETIQREIGENFQLNPQFVEEMMGFPIGWTELPL
jgi:hypothetical protein